jgi:hypothetical protein
MRWEMSENYTQCRFEKDSEVTVGFIPSHAAKVGNKVQLIDISEELWDVVSTGKEMPKAQVREYERNYKLFQISTRGGGID